MSFLTWEDVAHCVLNVNRVTREMFRRVLMAPIRDDKSRIVIAAATNDVIVARSTVTVIPVPSPIHVLAMDPHCKFFEDEGSCAKETASGLTVTQVYSGAFTESVSFQGNVVVRGQSGDNFRFILGGHILLRWRPQHNTIFRDHDRSCTGDDGFDDVFMAYRVIVKNNNEIKNA